MDPDDNHQSLLKPLAKKTLDVKFYTDGLG
jgi:hypothetical protein